MQFLTVSLLLASGVWALPSMREEWKRQNATDPATGAKIIPVAVGGAQDVFVPSQVTAAAGDIIQFQFSNGNHTVTQSAEDQACVPLQQTNAAAIHSGHIPFADGQQEVGTFNMVVQNTDTMFLYCATGPHCQEGQVMVINPTSDQQILDYAKRAAAATANVDGGAVSGGIVGKIALSAAVFTPAPPEDPAAAPPAAAAPAPSAAETPAAEAGTAAAALPIETPPTPVTGAAVIFAGATT